eukprot:m.48264 g.48264  ORF g.48264 m.48264 type:complete len:90 (+) comp13276_c0_seq11:1291-1560(+)
MSCTLEAGSLIHATKFEMLQSTNKTSLFAILVLSRHQISIESSQLMQSGNFQEGCNLTNAHEQHRVRSLPLHPQILAHQLHVWAYMLSC